MKRFATVTDGKLVARVIPAGTTINEFIRPGVKSELYDFQINNVGTPNTLEVLLKDQSGWIFNNDNTPIVPLGTWIDFPSQLYVEPNLYMSVKNDYRLGVQIANVSAGDITVDVTTSLLMEHWKPELNDPTFWKNLEKRTYPWFGQAFFNFPIGTSSDSQQIALGQDTIVWGGNAFVESQPDFFYIDIRSGHDNTGLGLTNQSLKMTRLFYDTASSVIPYRQIWPGCYFVGKNDILQITLNRFDTTMADSVYLNFEGRMWKT